MRATSSIDTRTETYRKGMDAIMEGRTVFVIAHRLSTVRNSKAIMVLEKVKLLSVEAMRNCWSKKEDITDCIQGSLNLNKISYIIMWI